MELAARCQLTLIVAAMPLAAQLNAPVSVITSVRHWSLDAATRVAIEVSEETKFRVEALQNPDRLYIDVDNAECRINGKRFAVFPVEDHLVRQLRLAQSQPSVVRVVLDLAAPVDYEISHLTAPHRLMIEVRAKRTNKPLASASPAAPPVSPPTSEAVSKPGGVTAAAGAARTSPVRTSAPEAPPRTEPPAPLPAKRNRDGSRSLTRTLGLKLGRIVIDPGHGGTDHGTTGVTGLREKDLVLDVAQRLGSLLEQKLSAQVIYTRTDDSYIALEERTAIANREKADLFLSIHANSSPASQAYGTETYYLRFTTSKAELETAARENASTSKSLYELQDLVKRITLQDKMEESREFAGRVQSSLYGVWSRSGNPARNRGLKKAPFVVLIGATMPSVLTEIGFLSNPREEGQLKKAEYRQKIAEALYRGIAQYVESLSHPALASAAQED
ncbi:MAG: N-acetylmuramoyl-L-alanine amidase [Bryobacterales bacterium]|nr:N-acetylmuramoyl-L-alanine amidase [Bryobacterales bacterium]